MTIKILALTDAPGNLVRFELLRGQRFDTVGVEPLLKGLHSAQIGSCLRLSVGRHKPGAPGPVSFKDTFQKVLPGHLRGCWSPSLLRHRSRCTIYSIRDARALLCYFLVRNSKDSRVGQELLLQFCDRIFVNSALGDSVFQPFFEEFCATFAHAGERHLGTKGSGQNSLRKI